MEFGKIFKFSIYCPFLTKQVHINYIFNIIVPFIVFFDKCSDNFGNEVVRLLNFYIGDVKRRTLDFTARCPIILIGKLLF